MSEVVEKKQADADGVPAYQLANMLFITQEVCDDPPSLAHYFQLPLRRKFVYSRNHKWPPSFYAILNDNHELLIDLVLDGANVQSRLPDGNSLLHHAAARGCSPLFYD